MITQNHAAIETAKLTIKQKEDLTLYRRLLLLTMVLYPVFGYVNTFVHSPAYETIAIFFQRLCFSLLILVFVSLSYFSSTIRNRFYTVISSFVYVGFSHLTYIALMNGYSMNHLVGIVLVYVGTSLVFRKNLHLNLYIIFATLVTLLVACVGPVGEISRLVVIMIFVSISTVIFIGMNMKIKAEIRLKHNEANFTAITENTSDLIWSIDINYRLLSANSAAITLFNIQGMKDITIGKKIDLLIITAKIKEEWEGYYQRALTGEIFTIIQLEENTAQTYEHSFYPIKSSKGLIRGTCVFSRNITEQIDRENKLKDAQKIAKTGSFSRNYVTGKYVWSDYMYELFQLPKTTDIASLDMKKFIHPEDYSEYDKLFNSNIHSNETILLKYKIVRSNFTVLPVISNVLFKHDDENNLIEISGTIQDYSEQYRTDQLERNNLELQKEKEFAEILNKQHESFLAKMSHEIRTPMNSIVGISNLFAKTTFIDPKHREYIHALKINSEKLLHIINDVLDYSNIEQEGIILKNEPYSIRELFQSLIDSYKNEIDEKNIQLRYFIDPDVPDEQRGEVTQISRVLSNLLSNSIKFTQEGEIVLAVSLEHQTEKSFLIFKVIDTGIGITEDKTAKIFDTFVQLNEINDFKKSGTGLGLPICKKIIEYLGGEITVNSWVNLGSEFLVKIPTQLHEVISTNNVYIDETTSLQLLLVEDNTFNLMVAVETIESWNPNIKITIAQNGEEALKKLGVLEEQQALEENRGANNSDHPTNSEHQMFDIILMDIQMPIMDGHEATKRIRAFKNEQIASIPILAVTAHAFQEEIDKCYANGMNDYISKPFDGDLLIQKIKQLIPKKSISTATVEQGLPVSNVVNFGSIEEFTKGKKGRIEKMIRMFLTDTPVELKRLKALIQEQNYPAIQTLAHSFKPKYNYMGMPELSEIAKKMENSAKEQGNLEEMEGLLNYLNEQTEIAYRELEEYIADL